MATARQKKPKLKATYVHSTQGDSLGYDPHTGFLYIGLDQYSCSDVRGLCLHGNDLSLTMASGSVHHLTVDIDPRDEFLDWVITVMREHHCGLIRETNAGYKTLQTYSYTPDVTCAYYVGGTDKVIRVQRGTDPQAQYLDYKIGPDAGRRKFREECTTLAQRELLSELELAKRAAARTHQHTPDHAFFRFNSGL